MEGVAGGQACKGYLLYPSPEEGLKAVGGMQPDSQGSSGAHQPQASCLYGRREPGSKTPRWRSRKPSDGSILPPGWVEAARGGRGGGVCSFGSSLRNE